jgi:signal peptidase I
MSTRIPRLPSRAVITMRGSACVRSGARCALLALAALLIAGCGGSGSSGAVSAPATVTVRAAGAQTATASSTNGASHDATSTAAASARSSSGSATRTSAADASAPSAETGIPFPVHTASMEPTYQPGTTVYYDPTRTTPQIGEVIVFHPPAGIKGGRCAAKETGNPCAAPIPGLSKELSIKRVVGLPGDTIAIHAGRVIRNGRPEREAPTLHCGVIAGCEFSKSIVVPAGEYFVMSDYRELYEEDSRVFGPVPEAAVVGTVEGN